MKAEVWNNVYGDEVVFVGEDYVIYNKCDRLGAEVICMQKDRPDTNIETIKSSYYKNGFRPIDENVKANSFYCKLCAYFGSCGDDVLTKKCCTCIKGRICPGQVYKTDNFELKKIESYEK